MQELAMQTFPLVLSFIISMLFCFILGWWVLLNTFNNAKHCNRLSYALFLLWLQLLIRDSVCLCGCLHAWVFIKAFVTEFIIDSFFSTTHLTVLFFFIVSVVSSHNLDPFVVVFELAGSCCYQYLPVVNKLFILTPTEILCFFFYMRQFTFLDRGEKNTCVIKCEMNPETLTGEQIQ